MLINNGGDIRPDVYVGSEFGTAHGGQKVPRILRAFMSDMDETVYCSNGLAGCEIAGLHGDSRVLAGVLEMLRSERGIKIIYNTGKEYPWAGYKINDGSFYDPILARPDAVISGGGANIHIFSEPGNAPRVSQAWRDHLAAQVGADDMWPMVEALSQRVPQIRMLGREWSAEQFINDPLRVPCVWDCQNEPFDILKVDALIKRELGEHVAVLIYPVIDGGFGICPASMNKAVAGRFALAQEYGIQPEDTAFAGDSMNDYHVFADGAYNCILVANAHAPLRDFVRGMASAKLPGSGETHICTPGMVAARGVMDGLSTLYPYLRASITQHIAASVGTQQIGWRSNVAPA